MWQILVPLAAAVGGGFLFVSRGKAHIGDTVEFMYKPGGPFGEQAIAVQGKVVEKTNPILGPYYSVQLFQMPKLPALENILPADRPVIPSTVGGIKDSDITRNLSRK